MRRIAFAAFAVASIAFPSVVYAAQLGATSDDTLYWNGGTSGTWDSTTENWLDASGAATAWVAGATACFTNDAAATVAIAAGGVSATCIQAHGHPLTFTSGTLTMVGSSELVMRTGLVRFECPIAGSGGLHITNGLYTSLLADSVWLTTTPVKFIENAALAGISSLYATPGGWIAAAYSTDLRSYFLVNDGQTLTAQMQCFDSSSGSGLTKCVAVELTQNGSDIYVKAIHAQVGSGDAGDIRGTDFEPSFTKKDDDYFLDNKYKLFKLRLGARVELAGANTFTGSLSADGATTIALVDGGTLTGGNFAGEVSLPNNSTLEIAHTRQKFSGNVVATGDTACSLVVKGTIDPSKNGTRTYSGTISGITNGEPQMLFPDVGENEISGWIGAEAYFAAGDYIGNAAGGKAETFYFWNDGMTAKAQFKIADYTNLSIGEVINNISGQNKWHFPYVYATIYEFSHNGSGIVANRLRSLVNEQIHQYQHPVDFLGHDIYDVGYGSKHYRCKDLTVAVSNVSDTAVTLAGSGNTFGKGYITVDGAVLGIASADLTAPAYYNTVNVKNKGKLFYTGTSDFLTNAKATIDNESRLAFCRKGSLAKTATLVAKNGSQIAIEGGAFMSNSQRNAATRNWLPPTTLAGTAISGGPFGIDNSTAKISASASAGSGAVRIAQSFYLSGTTELLFHVDDLSGDDGADLFIDGQIRDEGVDATPRPLKKSGVGTLRLGASNKRTDALYKDANGITQFGNHESWQGVFAVTGGKLLCGVDEALDGMSGIVLFGGGALDIDGTKTETGTLKLTGNGGIDLGDGGEISFADSSAVAWASGVKLAITGTGKVRFGGSASALTPAQLSAITLNGKNVKLSSAGYLRLPGLAIMIR